VGYVLWLLQWAPKLDARRYTPRLWEKWVHAAYFGRVYYWIEGLTVVSYHFDPNHRTIPQKTWYSPKGKKMTAGGYSQRSKRHRTPVRGKTFNLATDFGPRNRDWWKGKGITVPAAKLYIDRHRLSVRPSFTSLDFHSQFLEISGKIVQLKIKREKTGEIRSPFDTFKPKPAR
jgi:hypothetical protein